MKLSPLFAEERRHEIAKLLSDNAKLLTPSLCKTFDVSPATIRNDLRTLEREGILKRTHGGAIPAGKTAYELIGKSKEVECIEEKRKIAMFAETLVEDGDTIVLDTGTTTMELAKLLTDKENLTVVTSDIKIALYLEENSSANIYLLGGMIRRNFHCAMGAETINQLKGLSTDKAFIAVNALSVEKGFTTPSIELANVKAAMVATGATAVFLADSQKLNRASFAQIVSLDKAHIIVTDSKADRNFINRLKSENKHLEVVAV
ncbi:MAG: DeoR/GlpR family DNA-binding transcription regulator [Defluviitaleaceae bacterium]|nr:DeoR/GlpR family DNA-binding transcription regulator [Defluviitaleaceae bacterium]